MDGAGVPSPYDHTGDVWWHDRLAMEAHTLASAGVSDILTMPLWEGASMGNGYDPKFEYKMGYPNPTRAGSRERLHRAAAIAKANGLGLHADVVLAHRDGGHDNGYTFDFKTAEGVPYRFPKERTCWVGPHSPKDNVAVPSEDFASLFGKQISYYSGYIGDAKGSNGRGYPHREIIKALQWLKAALDLQGVRWDNVKSLDPSLIGDLAKQVGLWGTGEMWSSNMDQLLWWLFGTNVAGRSSLFDFPLAFEIRNFCNNTAKYNMAKLQYTGLYQRAPFNAVKFVNSHDMDTSVNRVVYNMLLGYALILTTEGLPCIYIKDWLTDIGYGLGSRLANQLWFRHFCAQGRTVWRHADYNIVAYERISDPGALVVLDNNSWAGPTYINVQTQWTNTWLHDYSGHMPPTKTDWQGRATVGGHKNDNGIGYTLYSKDGLQGKTIPLSGGPTTQRIEGGIDLDLSRATAEGRYALAIWPEPGTPIHLNKVLGDGVRYEITDPAGNPIIHRGEWAGEAEQAGWHTITAFSGSSGTQPHTLDVTYRAPKTLTAAQTKVNPIPRS
jgi:hypothetical protein